MPVSFRVSVGGPKCSNNEALHFGSSVFKHYDGSSEGMRLLVISSLLIFKRTSNDIGHPSHFLCFLIFHPSSYDIPGF
jgi:hypothetical protein